MFVPLPNLDDRRWTDLVDEGRSLIPVYSSGWTDHNESDPGITIMEMLAWITDGDIYKANRIPDAHRLAFLALIGVAPTPPLPATAQLQFQLNSAETAPLLLPANVELDATMLDGKPGKFHLCSAVSVLPVTLAAVQIQSAGKFRDATGDWTHAKPSSIFGPNPAPGDALCLGFAKAFHSGDLLNLYFEFQGNDASSPARQRILDELTSRMQACPPRNARSPQQCATAPPELPPHHSAAIVWEAQIAPNTWEPVEFIDNTRSMTLSGTVSLIIATAPPALKTGATPQPLQYLRCRLASGSFDDVPVALQVLENAGQAQQSSPLWEEWPIAAGVVAIGTPPSPGGAAWINLSFDTSGNINSLDFGSSAAEGIRTAILAYKPASAANRGSLTVEAIRLGVGTGAPHQLYQLSGPEICPRGFTVYTLENGGAKLWSGVPSFVASRANEPHYFLDAADAEVLFGDGQNGRVPPSGVPIIVSAHVTNASAGNVAAGALSALDLGPHNRAFVDVAATAAKLQLIRNPQAASGGAEQETVAHAEGRASQLVNEPERAVTLADCETLALETPGTSIARAAAIANFCPGLQCYSAPGYITVVIVPHLPLGRPVPSSGLLAEVSAYLNRRRVIGTRIEVIGPDYLEIAVTANVKAVTGQNKAQVRTAILAALQNFLDPLVGGPDGTGWPLGRAVYVSEILDTIAQVHGVDHVVSLALNAADCGTQCGDICLNPIALTVPGAHQIQVS